MQLDPSFRTCLNRFSILRKIFEKKSLLLSPDGLKVQQPRASPWV
jgi:hypothetical protein